MDNIKLESNNGTYFISLSMYNIFNPNTYIAILSIYDSEEAIYRGLLDKFKTINLNSRYFGYITANHNWRVKNER